jgi:hypothetical protein
LTRDGLIGVDVEATRQNALLEDVACQTFSTAEQAKLAHAPCSERQERFLAVALKLETNVEAVIDVKEYKDQVF